LYVDISVPLFRVPTNATASASSLVLYLFFLPHDQYPCSPYSSIAARLLFLSLRLSFLLAFAFLFRRSLCAPDGLA
jgi:hypothetical protein